MTLPYDTISRLHGLVLRRSEGAPVPKDVNKTDGDKCNENSREIECCLISAYSSENRLTAFYSTNFWLRVEKMVLPGPVLEFQFEPMIE